MAPKAPVNLRDVTPLVSAWRNFLVGRKCKNPLRFESQVAPRNQPPPDLPEGPAHRLADNYYYLHDSRREMIPPVALNATKALPSGTEEPKAVGAQPGKIYNWD